MEVSVFRGGGYIDFVFSELTVYYNFIELWVFWKCVVLRINLMVLLVRFRQSDPILFTPLLYNKVLNLMTH